MISDWGQTSKKLTLSERLFAHLTFFRTKMIWNNFLYTFLWSLRCDFQYFFFFNYLWVQLSTKIKEECLVMLSLNGSIQLLDYYAVNQRENCKTWFEKNIFGLHVLVFSFISFPNTVLMQSPWPWQWHCANVPFFAIY